MGRFLKKEKFKFSGSIHSESVIGGAFQHTTQCSARANIFPFACELAEEKREIVFKRNKAHRFRHHAHFSIRIARVPACNAYIVIELVIRIPSDHDVTKAQAFFQRTLELVTVHIFAAKHAINIEHAQADIRHITFADIGKGISGIFEYG